MRRRFLPTLVVLLALGLTALEQTGTITVFDRKPREATLPEQSPESFPLQASAQATAVVTNPALSLTPMMPFKIPSKGAAPKPGTTSQHAYRFVMNHGQCALEAVEEVQGNFHRKRAQSWAPGRLCYQLLNAASEVIAEETSLAPDHYCVVLDPNQPDAAGTPKAAHLTPDGPVTFQVRLPIREDAVLLKIYRLTGFERPVKNAQPQGLLLASLPLTH